MPVERAHDSEYDDESNKMATHLAGRLQLAEDLGHVTLHAIASLEHLVAEEAQCAKHADDRPTAKNREAHARGS